MVRLTEGKDFSVPLKSQIVTSNLSPMPEDDPIYFHLKRVS